MVYTVVMRKELPAVISLIQETHPRAFITVEELRCVTHGIFPDRPGAGALRIISREKGIERKNYRL